MPFKIMYFINSITNVNLFAFSYTVCVFYFDSYLLSIEKNNVVK